MNFYQVEFTGKSWEPDEKPAGGIAMYTIDDVLCYVINGETGAYYYPDEIATIKRFDDWIDISKDIIGD